MKIGWIIAIVAIVVAVFSAAGIIIASKLFSSNFTRAEYKKKTASYFYKDYADKYPEKFRRKSVSFMSGKNRLQGYIYGPADAKGLIVIAHGIGNGHEYFINEISYFLDKGWRILAYDATGSCESEGKSTTSLIQSALDLKAALGFALSDEELAKMKMCLFGHSWGGFAVTAVLNFNEVIKNVKAVASVSGYNSPIKMTMSFAKNEVGALATFLYPAAWLHYRRLHGKNNTITAIKGINNVDIPVRVYHAENDKLIKINDTSIYAKRDKATNKNAEFFVRSGEFMDEHSTLFRNKENAEYVEKARAGYEEIEKSYRMMKKKVPDSITEAYYKDVDREKFNKINYELIGGIEEFFSEKIGEN